MEGLIKLFVGLVLFTVGVGYLYRPGWVIRSNEWVRRIFFNDAHLLHHRRRWGLLFFLVGVLLMYSGFLNLSVQP